LTKPFINQPTNGWKGHLWIQHVITHAYRSQGRKANDFPID
jgi:hypothetical protein